MRNLLSLLLSLVLGLSSVTIAVARSQSPAVDQITICSGYGVVSMAVDADGNPTGPVHPCPECLSGFVFALGSVAPVLSTPVSRRMAFVPPVARLSFGQTRQTPQARGPPVLTS